MGFFEAAWGDRFQGKCLVEGSLLNERRSWEMADLTCRSWYTWRIIPGIVSSYIVTLIYKPWSSAIWKGSHVALLRGRKRSPGLLTTYVRHGMILQVDAIHGCVQALMMLSTTWIVSTRCSFSKVAYRSYEQRMMWYFFQSAERSVAAKNCILEILCIPGSVNAFQHKQPCNHSISKSLSAVSTTQIQILLCCPF